MEQSLDDMVAQVRVALDDTAPSLGDDPNLDRGQAPRFELFHGANSICSQKVRTVLAYHGTPHIEHAMNLFLGQTYLPSYVRLRMAGCERMAAPLMTAHNGNTSVSDGGCDAAVVPTLVDWRTNEIIVDSKRICLYLDELVDDAERLRPSHLAAAIDEELRIVDGLPNYQMLLGKRPDMDEAATRKGHSGSSFSLDKVKRCDRLMQDHADDPVLVQAYAAKRAKELDAADHLFSDEAMRSAYATAVEACATLDTKLRERGSPWLFGDKVTMADLFWCVELLRMKNLGASTFWDGGRLPEVARFTAAAEQLPSIKAAIIDWPGALF